MVPRVDISVFKFRESCEAALSLKTDGENSPHIEEPNLNAMVNKIFTLLLRMSRDLGFDTWQVERVYVPFKYMAVTRNALDRVMQQFNALVVANQARQAWILS